MPRIRTSRTKPPPEGYEDIQYVSPVTQPQRGQLDKCIIHLHPPINADNLRDVLEDYDKKMRDAESDSHEGKRKTEAVWYVFSLRGFDQ